MSEATPNDADIAPRGKVKDPFCLIGNHDFDVFLPIMGADCFTIYAYFVRRVSVTPNSSTQSGAWPMLPGSVLPRFCARSKSWSTCDW